MKGGLCEPDKLRQAMALYLTILLSTIVARQARTKPTITVGHRRRWGSHVTCSHILHLPASLRLVLNMLSALRPTTGPLFRAVGSNSRPFVSTLLLSKSWDHETVADLKKELKKRGLTS